MTERIKVVQFLRCRKSPRLLAKWPKARRNGRCQAFRPTFAAQVGLSATDNTITNLPAEDHDAVGIFGGYLFGAVIAHNSLENLSCECRCCAAFALPCSDPEMRRLGH